MLDLTTALIDMTIEVVGIWIPMTEVTVDVFMIEIQDAQTSEI